MIATRLKSYLYFEENKMNNTAIISGVKIEYTREQLRVALIKALHRQGIISCEQATKAIELARKV